MTRLAFESVMLARGGRVLFDALSFDLRAGDALRVSGANGAGKSSLLRLAVGLLEQQDGRVIREGTTALADERAALDDLPLSRALGFWARLDNGKIALDAVGLGKLAEVPARMLSTGQRRRASIARMVGANASIWLLDEPTNGLDAASTALVEAIVHKHRASGGIAVVATHQAFDLPGAREIAL